MCVYTCPCALRFLFRAHILFEFAPAAAASSPRNACTPPPAACDVTRKIWASCARDTRLATSHRREIRCTASTLRRRHRPQPPDLVHSSALGSVGRAAAALLTTFSCERCFLRNRFSNLLPIRDRPSTLTSYSIRDHQYILSSNTIHTDTCVYR